MREVRELHQSRGFFQLLLCHGISQEKGEQHVQGLRRLWQLIPALLSHPTASHSIHMEQSPRRGRGEPPESDGSIGENKGNKRTDKSIPRGGKEIHVFYCSPNKNIKHKQIKGLEVLPVCDTT